MDQEEAYTEENQHPEQELSPEEYQEDSPALLLPHLSRAHSANTSVNIAY